MQFFPAKIDDSTLEHQVWLNEEGSILLMKFSGTYPKGSEGNYHGNFMYAKLHYYYAFYEPLVIVLNLANLEYEWGNTILKALSFFKNLGEEGVGKNLLVVVSQNNRQAIENILGLVESSNQLVFFEDERIALKEAQYNVEHFLDS